MYRVFDIRHLPSATLLASEDRQRGARWVFPETGWTSRFGTDEPTGTRHVALGVPHGKPGRRRHSHHIAQVNDGTTMSDTVTPRLFVENDKANCTART